METMKKIELKWTTKEQLERYAEFENDSKNIDDALASVKIVDPAVWSGAFPMWILKEIVSLRTYIQRNIFLNEDKDLQYKLKKQALENNIYWVDIDPGAVDIAKLRFWLSLIIENDTQDIEPLPNLDYKIMQWNSLLNQLIIWDSIINIISDKDLNKDKITKKLQNSWAKKATLFDELRWTEDLIQKIKFFHKKYFQTKDVSEKKALKEQIDEVEKKLIRAGCEEEISRIKTCIDNIENRRFNWLEITDKELKELEKLNNKILSIREIEKQFEEDHIRPFFPWKLHFWDVFKDNWGFDIVIWNPPYIQLQKDWWILWKLYENCWFETFTKMWDIYCLFYEKWFELLKEWWILSYITSNKWMKAWYWKQLRGFFANNTNPLYVIDLWPWVFETATVDTNILISENIAVKSFSLKWIDLVSEEDISDIKDFYDRAIIINDLSSDVRTIQSWWNAEITEKMRSVWKSLKDWDVQINYWIKTWLNEAFIIPKERKDEILNSCMSKDEKEKTIKLINPILRWRDVGKYSYSLSNLYMICTFPAKHYDINEYPSVKNYLLSFWKERLEQSWKDYWTFKSRKKTWNKRFETQDQISYYDFFNKDKLVWSETAQEVKVQIVEPWIYLDKTCFLCVWDNLKYIAWILNSKLIDFYARKYLSWLWKKWLSLKKEDMQNIPIPEIKWDIGDKITNIVDKIIEDKKKWIDTSELENKIDIIVYKIYELTYGEVKMIDSEFKLTEEEYNNYKY